MKKIFNYACVCAAVLAAASCQKNELTEADYVTATFTVEAPAELATRAIGDGKTAKNLVFAVYPYDHLKPEDPANLTVAELANLRQTDVTFDSVNEKGQPVAKVEVTLVRGKAYQFVCWAQSPKATCYDVTDMRAIKVTYDGNAQNEDRDAFFAREVSRNDNSADKSPLIVEGFSQTIVLHRPFAQVNVGAADMEAAKDAGLAVDQIKSKMTVKGVATELNAFTGETSGETNAEFAIAPAISPAEPLTINATGYEGKSYGWLAMNYVLPTTDGGVDIDFALYDGSITTSDYELARYTVTNPTLRQNYRTHLLGEVLTTKGTINVVIEPAFENEDNVVGIK